jgi:hypothetical protein
MRTFEILVTAQYSVAAVTHAQKSQTGLSFNSNPAHLFVSAQTSLASCGNRNLFCYGTCTACVLPTLPIPGSEHTLVHSGTREVSL